MPLGRQVVERDRAADRGRLAVERSVEAGRELQGAQHAQAVVGERARVDHAQDAVPRGPRRPSNGSTYLVGERIPRDRVDGEVAAAGGLGERQVRIALHGERPCDRARSSTRGAAARRRSGRACRRGRLWPTGSTRPSAPSSAAARPRRCRTPRGRGPSTRARAGGRGRSRRQPALVLHRPVPRGRRPGPGRAAWLATARGPSVLAGPSRRQAPGRNGEPKMGPGPIQSPIQFRRDGFRRTPAPRPRCHRLRESDAGHRERPGKRPSHVAWCSSSRPSACWSRCKRWRPGGRTSSRRWPAAPQDRR